MLLNDLDDIIIAMRGGSTHARGLLNDDAIPPHGTPRFTRRLDRFGVGVGVGAARTAGAAAHDLLFDHFDAAAAGEAAQVEAGVQQPEDEEEAAHGADDDSGDGAWGRSVI